jgi:hypothetical protein
MTEAPVKRKRGRPRKNPLVEPVVSLPLKRPRGRPRKIVAEAPAAAPAPVVKVTTRKVRSAARAPINMGVEHFSTVLKMDRSGNPLLTRNAKYIDGKLVREMTYDYKKDEANFNIKELV